MRPGENATSPPKPPIPARTGALSVPETGPPGGPLFVWGRGPSAGLAAWAPPVAGGLEKPGRVVGDGAEAGGVL